MAFLSRPHEFTEIIGHNLVLPITILLLILSITQLNIVNTRGNANFLWVYLGNALCQRSLSLYLLEQGRALLRLDSTSSKEREDKAIFFSKKGSVSHLILLLKISILIQPLILPTLVIVIFPSLFFCRIFGILSFWCEAPCFWFMLLINLRVPISRV